MAAALLLSVIAALPTRVPVRIRATTIGCLLFFAVGLQVAPRKESIPVFDPDRFVHLEVPLERDWAVREQAHVLRATSFQANGTEVREPISVYARFVPEEMVLERTLIAEAAIRANDQGRLTATIKAPELMSYAGRLDAWHPSAWNRMLANRLERHAEAYPEEVALAQALVLGRGERLTPEMRESFRRGGTYHLLVFSGLQIAFAAGVLAALLRWLGAPRASDWLLLLFAALAPPFIGSTASVARASLAIGLYAFSRILRRPTSLENLWCVAALLRLILVPGDLTDVSFHLTYAGAGALIFIGKRLFGQSRSRTVRTLAYLTATEITLTPLTLAHFHQYTVGGALITLVMAPAMFAMLVASAVSCAWPHDFVFEVIRLLHRICRFLNLGGMSGWYASPPVPILIGIAFAMLATLGLTQDRRRAGLLAILLLVPTCAAVVKSRRASRIDAPRVSVLDVGQGDAILIRTSSQTILVDGGRNDRVLTLLAERGVRRIDLAVLTHAHPDHCGGLAQVIRDMPVSRLWLSPRRFRDECAGAILESANAARTPIQLIREERIERLGQLSLEVILADLRFRQAPENNSSIVLRITAGGRRFLLTGDIEKEAELVLFDRDLRADVLKVAHHGSRTSTSRTFLENVRPRLAVISCGRRNLFGHPHVKVLDALQTDRIRLWRTDQNGSVDVEVREGRLYARSAID
jgi:competence protein ComEC